MIPRHILNDLYKEVKTEHDVLIAFFDGMVVIKTIYESFYEEGMTLNGEDYVTMSRDLVDELERRYKEVADGR